MGPWSTTTTTLSGALWFLCVCVTLTVNTDVTLSRTWCYASDSEDGVPHKLSCNHGNVLWVAAAVPSIHTANRHGFCRGPSPSGSDCPLEAAPHTDHYRRMCDGRVSCTFLLTRKPPNTCPGQQQGPMYLHMQYACVPATDAAGRTFPTVHPVVSERAEAGSGELWLVSTGYPMDYEDMAEVRCSLLTDPGTRLEVSILDLSVVLDLVHRTRQQQLCLYSLSVGNHSAVCAGPGVQAHTFNIEPGPTGGSGERMEMHVHLTAPEPHTGPARGRFWVRVTGYQGDSVVPAPFSVSCTNPLSPYVATSTGNESPSVAHIVVPVILILIVIIVVIVIVGILIWWRRKRKAKEEENPDGASPDENHESCAHSGEVTGLWGEALKADSKDADSEGDGEAGEDENLNKRRASRTDEAEGDKPENMHKSTAV